MPTIEKQPVVRRPIKMKEAPHVYIWEASAFDVSKARNRKKPVLIVPAIERVTYIGITHSWNLRTTHRIVALEGCCYRHHLAIRLNHG